MCGIAGFFGKKPLELDRIHNTLALMTNRGPDHQAYLSLESSPHCTLLHSRLSIIDLDPRSNQPFSESGYSLVFNGEIYNYIELRKRLEAKGHLFKTESDTEVILKSYMTYGEECVREFEGMWSLAIYDQSKNKLFLSRDRFAEKPLYYLINSEGFYFASEIKYIKQLAGKTLPINYTQLLRYLINGYRSLYKTQDTFFQDINELPFASNMVVQGDLGIHISRYWIPTYTPKSMNFEEAIFGVRERLLNSVQLRLRADVPIAFCLSGGVDSSAIASIAKKQFNYDVHTYSIIDPDERYNEWDNIDATIRDLECKSTIITLSPQEDFDYLEKLIRYHDVPIATISYYIQSFLSKEISSDGFRISVSGTAADEFFSGYYDHFNLYLYEMMHSKDFNLFLQEWEDYIKPSVRNPYLNNPFLYFEDDNFRSHIYLDSALFANLLKSSFEEAFDEVHYSKSLLRNRMLNELFHEGSRVILHEDDLNAMYYSVENRSPYLDSNLFEFAYSIPNELLIHKGYGKYLLREAVKGILNDQVRTDRKKKGFNASINSVFNLASQKVKDYILEDSPIYDIFSRKKINKFFNDNDFNLNSTSKFMFSFINAKVFLENNV